jgi:hypothetical protein
MDVFYSFEHEYFYNVHLVRNWKATVGAKEVLYGWSTRIPVFSLAELFQGVAKLKQNPEELDRILKNHIVRGKVQ